MFWLSATFILLILITISTRNIYVLFTLSIISHTQHSQSAPSQVLLMQATQLKFAVELACAETVLYMYTQKFSCQHSIL